jgi:hypothetical protein
MRMNYRAYRAQGEKRNACRVLFGNPEGKILLGTPRLK